MDPYRKVSAGKPISFSATAHNAGVDAARAHAASLYGFGGGKDIEPSTPVLVLNESGGDRVEGEILSLYDMQFSPDVNIPEARRQVTFKGKAPAHDHSQRFGVLLEPIAAGRFGKCCIWGDCIALIEGDNRPNSPIIDRTAYQFVGTKPDSFVLHTAPEGGAQILWQTAATDLMPGQRNALIRIGAWNWSRWQVVVSDWDTVEAIEIPPGFTGWNPGAQFDTWADETFGDPLEIPGTGTFRTSILDGRSMPGPVPKGAIVWSDGRTIWAGPALGIQRVALAGSAGSFRGEISWGIAVTTTYDWTVDIADPLNLGGSLVAGVDAYIAPIQYFASGVGQWRWELIQAACPAE